MIKENSSLRKTDIINRRMFVIGAAKIIIFGGIIVRLFYFIFYYLDQKISLQQND